MQVQLRLAILRLASCRTLAADMQERLLLQGW